MAFRQQGRRAGAARRRRSDPRDRHEAVPRRGLAGSAGGARGPSEPKTAPSRPRSVRIVARGSKESVNTVFTIHEHPLWIGRKGCHVELAEAELSIRHCSIFVRGDKLVVRDADSHMGTFLDGQPVDEAVIEDGVHLLRVGSALVSVEPTEQSAASRSSRSPRVLPAPSTSRCWPEKRARAHDATRRSRARGARSASKVRWPARSSRSRRADCVVGREGHVRVPDEFLSRRHFEVARDEDGVVRVRDLGSRNGTFLNTLPARNTKVHTGDEIRRRREPVSRSSSGLKRVLAGRWCRRSLPIIARWPLNRRWLYFALSQDNTYANVRIRGCSDSRAPFRAPAQASLSRRRTIARGR